MAEQKTNASEPAFQEKCPVIVALEEHGLVIRRELNQIPPHVEYSLSDSCRELIPALEIINDWGATQMPGEVRACRQAQQAQRETGQEPPAQE